MSLYNFNGLLESLVKLNTFVRDNYVDLHGLSVKVLTPKSSSLDPYGAQQTTEYNAPDYKKVIPSLRGELMISFDYMSEETSPTVTCIARVRDNIPKGSIVQILVNNQIDGGQQTLDLQVTENVITRRSRFDERTLTLNPARSDSVA